MNIAILGGSFDPPHVGHVLIAQQILEKCKMDEIWLMPAYQHPFAKDLTKLEHRIAMTRLVESKSTKYSDFEISEKRMSYTIDTLEKIKQVYPDHTFSWILGSDQLESFQHYNRWQDIRDNHSLIVFPRETVIGHLEEKTKQCLQLQAIPDTITLLHDRDLLLTNISSTLVRERVKQNKTLLYITTPEVEAYIKTHTLYNE